jgi:hypothetical protein
MVVTNFLNNEICHLIVCFVFSNNRKNKMFNIRLLELIKTNYMSIYNTSIEPSLVIRYMHFASLLRDVAGNR